MPASATEHIDFLRGLRQYRRFTDKPIPEDVVNDLLEVARWSGSAKNVQPWHFIVVDDPQTLQGLSEASQTAGFVAGAKLAIVLTLNESSRRSAPYDEGRASERLMLAGQAHGLGSGTAWFSTPEAQKAVRELLGIPEDREVWSLVAFGYTDEAAERTATGPNPGRKPLAELVSYGKFGQQR